MNENKEELSRGILIRGIGSFYTARDPEGNEYTLRCKKNRFGAINEIGIFAMVEKGMREVSNPSAIFLNRSDVVSSGSLVMVVWEGSRPLLVELQALVDYCQYGNPRRLTLGTEANRLSMLLAVLHKHGGLSLGDHDVFINVVGGVKVEETSADLPLILSLLSSYRNSPIDRDLISFGEIGLNGEVRPVTQGTERLQEAYKHGFKQAIIPFDNNPRKPIGDMKNALCVALNEFFFGKPTCLNFCKGLCSGADGLVFIIKNSAN